MANKICYLSLIILCGLMIVSCGGVQRNPTQPPWNQNQQQPGTQPVLPGGQGTKPAAKAGGEGQILEGDYESLIPQAEGALETGDLQTAFNAYHSALQQKQGDPTAGFGKAITQIAKDWRTFAIFRAAGADKLYYNTPLLMYPELLPNPVMADDSYLLRLFTIGRKYEDNFDITLPSWGVKPVPKENGLKLPVASGGGKGPVVSQPGGEEGGKPSSEGEGEVKPPETAPPETKPPEEGEGGGQNPPPGEETPENGGEESAGHPNLPEGWTPLANRTGQQRDLPGGTPPEDWEEWQEKFQESGGQLPEGLTTPIPSTPGKLPEGSTPIDSEYFKKELPLTITALENEGASLRIEQLASHIINMQTNLESLITQLEDISKDFNEDFIFQVGIVMRDKNEKYTMIFRKQDYDVLLGELRILSGIIDYVTTYNSTMNYVSYTYPAEDTNNDGKYSSDEYYPMTPFGTIIDEAQSVMQDAQDKFLQGLDDASSAWDLILERAYQETNESTNELLALPTGGVHSAILDAQKELYDNFSNKFNDSLQLALKGKGGKVEVKVAPSVIFSDKLGDVRAVLPCIDMMGSLVPCDEALQDIWPMPDFGGLFPDGLEDDSTVIRMGKVRGLAMDNNYMLYEGGAISYAGGQSEISETGEFLLSGVEFNELIGLQITLTPPEGEPWEGSIHSMVENIYTLPQLPNPASIPGGGGEVRIPGLGGTVIPGEGGTSTETPTTDSPAGSITSN